MDRTGVPPVYFRVLTEMFASTKAVVTSSRRWNFSSPCLPDLSLHQPQRFAAAVKSEAASTVSSQ
jgi:hypothetical protein